MGRRKKENGFPYTDIVISTYVKNHDYQQAQLHYSNNIEANRASNLNVNELVEVDMDDFEDDDGD